MINETNFRSAPAEDESITLTLRGRLAEHIVQVLGESATADKVGAARDIAFHVGTGANFKLARSAKRELAQRRLRTTVFGRAMFGEPPWEALLTLYADGGRLKIGELADLCDVAPTTMIRWLVYLEDAQLVQRESHPTDGRAVFVKLTEKGTSKMDSYFSETLDMSA